MSDSVTGDAVVTSIGRKSSDALGSFASFAASSGSASPSAPSVVSVVSVSTADFGNQQLTQLLLGDATPRVGMTEVLLRDRTLAKAVVDIPVESKGSLHLLSRGSANLQGPDFFANEGTPALFASLAEAYDLVLIDAPPLLRVAYATKLARLADRALIVVAHGQAIDDVAELRNQLDLVGTDEVGYVYNFAPLRAEMTLSTGSMADTVGVVPQRSSQG